MLVGLLEAAMVVVDDRVENLSEQGVSLGVRRVDAHAGVVVLQAGLDDVQQRGAEGRLASLQLIEHLLRQVFLQQRLAVGCRQLSIAGFQLVQNSRVHHVVALLTVTAKATMRITRSWLRGLKLNRFVTWIHVHGVPENSRL